MAEPFDALAALTTNAKREVDATVWGVALASPGLLGSLSQAQNLFRATRYPEIVGYVFGAMQCAFLLSIILGVIAYYRLNLVMSLVDTQRSRVWSSKEFLELIKEQASSDTPDASKTVRFAQRGIAAREESLELLRVIREFHDLPWRRQLPEGQRILIAVGYILFVVVVVTSDFFKLVG